MLATFTVSTTTVSGPGSLPQAIADSNSTAGHDTIEINDGLNTIQLTSQLDIADSVTINGNGNTIAGATDTARIFEVFPSSAEFNLVDITLSGGGSFSMSGGAVQASGSTAITVTNSTLSGNKGLIGGAINATGPLTITDSSFSGNAAATNGGAIHSSADVTIINSAISGNTAKNGGGLFAIGSGEVTLDGSNVSENRVTGDLQQEDAKGGGIYAGDVTLRTNNSTVSRNTAKGGEAEFGGDGRGGGIFSSRGSVSVTNSTLSGNKATGGDGRFGNDGGGDGHGGGVFSSRGSVSVTNSTISGNRANGGDGSYYGGSGGGGGVFTTRGSIFVTNSTISGNTTCSGNGPYSGSGGGGVSGGEGVFVTNSTIADNESCGGHYSFNRRGGGISGRDGNVFVTNSTISGNTSGDGGGIASLEGNVFVTNSTVSGNTSELAGGIASWKGNVSVTNSTVTGNDSLYYESGGINSAKITLTNSIVANSVGGPDVRSSTKVIANYSLIEDATNVSFEDGSSNNITGQDPMLGPLTNNGGPTLTHALLRGSPAIDHGEPNFTSPPSIDQRGQHRVLGGRLDIGAVEAPIPFSATNIFISGTHWARVIPYQLTNSVSHSGTSGRHGRALPWMNLDTISVDYTGADPVAGDLTLSDPSLGLTLVSVSNTKATWRVTDPTNPLAFLVDGVTTQIGPKNDLVVSAGGLAVTVDVVPGDINSSLVADDDDIAEWASNQGAAPSLRPPYSDVDGSGFTDTSDLNAILVAIDLAATDAPKGDVNSDGTVDSGDVNHVCDSISGPFDDRFDFDENGAVEFADVEAFIGEVIGTRMGDANLDGMVGAADLSRVGANWLKNDNFGWADGDFNCDDHVDTHDLTLLGLNWPSEKNRQTATKREVRAATSLVMETAEVNRRAQQSTAIPTQTTFVHRRLRDLRLMRRNRATTESVSRHLCEVEIVDEIFSKPCIYSLSSNGESGIRLS